MSGFGPQEARGDVAHPLRRASLKPHNCNRGRNRTDRYDTSMSGHRAQRSSGLPTIGLDDHTDKAVAAEGHFAAILVAYRPRSATSRSLCPPAFLASNRGARVFAGSDRARARVQTPERPRHRANFANWDYGRERSYPLRQGGMGRADD